MIPLVTRFAIEFSALTFDLIRAATAKNPECQVPIYGEVLLDAIEASFVSDYRKAILYSAIAVETMAATRIEEAHAEAVAQNSPNIRIIEMTQARGSLIRKDPVYEELRKASERNFKLLLNALPLYVWRRSLLSEKEKLYQDLIRLHGTRNDLVHSATVDGEDRWPIDGHGARHVLDAALAAFSWFGAAGRYVTLWSVELDAGWTPRPHGEPLAG